jgi:hypothetical protein
MRRKRTKTCLSQTHFKNKLQQCADQLAIELFDKILGISEINVEEKCSKDDHFVASCATFRDLNVDESDVNDDELNGDIDGDDFDYFTVVA